jgi:pimeloyl-ACP methyl ester carboxylesterase
LWANYVEIRKRSKRFTLTLILVLGFATFCDSSSSTGSSNGVTSAIFKPGACPAKQAKALTGLGASCGTLTVPEKRSNLKEGKVELPVAIIPSTRQPPLADPVAYMAGGPGANAIEQAQDLVNVGLNHNRNLIIMNQRGVAYTVPNLACPEIDMAFAAAVGLPYDSQKTQHVAATKACHDRLVAEGVDLSAFNTAENEADFADLRRALKIKQWNVYGLSYGTDLALSLMRDDPDGLRSVIIDAVLPPAAVSLGWTWTNQNEAINNIFRACANQPACAAQYGDLSAQFIAQVQKLEANPLRLTVPIPGTGTNTQVVLDGGAILNWIGSLPDPVVPIASVPAAINALVQGQPTQIAEARAVAANPAAIGAVGYGLMYGVICSEWVPFEPASQILVQGQLAFPALPHSVLSQPPGLPFMTEDCGVWDVPPAAASVRQITVSTIPTLVLNGSFDGKSAPQWGVYAAGTLRNSTTVTVPGSGHGALFLIQLPPDAPARACTQNVVASFLSNPLHPDTTCVASLTVPAFRTSVSESSSGP